VVGGLTVLRKRFAFTRKSVRLTLRGSQCSTNAMC